MSVVAVFVVPDSVFIFGKVLVTQTETTVRLESVVPTGSGVVPYFWIQNEAAEEISEALEASPLADEIKAVDEANGETLFRVQWSLDDDPVIDALRAADGALLEALADDGTWTLHIRFNDRDDVSTFYQCCVDAGVTPTLSELHSNSVANNNTGMGLTDPQREALEAALDSGYYTVPRATTLQQLAASLGISDTALSQRLRRGLTTVLSTTVGEPAAGVSDRTAADNLDDSADNLDDSAED